MKASTKRSILRWTHIVFSFPIMGYVYSPFEEIPAQAPAVRYFFLPALIVTGLWLWQGHVLKRLIRKSPAEEQAPNLV
ncbi:hypothetical protein [Schlesneria sp. T3-172]|uniref:hypothetical protein n=1 Tax=Schlesneria TaxID=656899 RepID=UPI002EF65893